MGSQSDDAQARAWLWVLGVVLVGSVSILGFVIWFLWQLARAWSGS